MMKKIIVLFLISSTSLILFSCGGNNKNDENTNKVNNPLDNILNFAITEKYQSLDPIKISDMTSFYIGSQIFESLVRFDEKDLSLRPSIANSWIISENGLVYTFNLRKDVFFHDNECFDNGKGRNLNANDVVYSFKRICSNLPNNFTYNTFKDKIKGAESCYKSSKDIDEKELEGVKAIDDYTVEFTLTHSSPQFLPLLATFNASIVAKEAIKNNAIIGTGPFIYDKENDTDTSIVLSKNTNYYLKDKEGNKLPYIDGVSYKVVDQGQKRLDDFMAGKLDIIKDIPPTAIKNLVETQIAAFQDKPEKYFLVSNQELSTSYLSFNTIKAPLNNIKVRQALAYAINKTRIVNDVLKGEAYGPADYGFVPPSVRNYDFSSVIGKEFNVKKAKKLLAEAGFKDGKNFPILKLITSQSNAKLRVALDIQKQLKANLNINIEISSTTLAKLMHTESYSKGDISLSSWIADYPNALTFLVLGYGRDIPKTTDLPSFPNSSRYTNQKFDKLYSEAMATSDEKKKNELCLAADQILVNDVPILPLWYREKYMLVQATVKNFSPNPMLIQYLVNVKIEAPKTPKKKNK